MRAFTSPELKAFRRTQEGAMMDTCIIMAYTESTSNSYGKPTVTYVDGAAIDCGYKPTQTREVQQGNDTVTIDAQLRLPVATVVKSTDRIRLTKRYGEAITPLYFEVVGQPARGPSGLVVTLRRLTGA